jgi:hypothetical protein
VLQPRWSPDGKHIQRDGSADILWWSQFRSLDGAIRAAERVAISVPPLQNQHSQQMPLKLGPTERSNPVSASQYVACGIRSPIAEMTSQHQEQSINTTKWRSTGLTARDEALVRETNSYTKLQTCR